MDLGRPANDPYCHWHFKRAYEVSIFIFAPSGEGSVTSVAGRVRVSACFNGAPIVARSDDYRVYAVHNSLVVGCGTVWIGCGEGICGDNAVTYGLTFERFKPDREFAHRNGTACACNSAVCQVGQNTQVDFSACDGFDLWSELFAGCIHCICAHGIAHIINEVQDEEWPDGRFFDGPHFEVAGSAAEFLQHRVNGIGQGE